MDYRDYYATLGVGRTATQAEIKKAFRKLARKHHPDVNAADGKAEARFKEVNEAYDVLGDPEKRKLYDQLGANWEAYQRAGAGTPGADPFAGFRAGAPGGVRFEYHGDPADLAGFSDFFRTFFADGSSGPSGPATGGATRGRARRAGRPAASADAGSAPGGRASAGTTPSLEDLLSGMGGGYRIDYGGDDPFAAGNGRQGIAPARRQTLEAEVELDLEDVATGTTALVQAGGRRLEVTVPAGVETGRRIRLSRGGGTGPDAADVVLVARVRPHPTFSRSGADLTRELPLTLGEALLGAEVRVATLTGKTLLLQIPAGTQPGRTFRLRGQGLPRFKADGRGDLLVRARVVLPAHLDPEARTLAEALVERVAQPDPRGGAGAETSATVRTDHEPATTPTT